MPLSNLLKGVRDKCISDFQFGFELLESYLADPNEYENIIAAIIVGLYEHRKNEFNENYLNRLIDEGVVIKSIFNAFSNLKKLTLDDCKRVLDLSDQFSKKKEITFSILSALLSIIKSNHSQLHEKTLQQINDLLYNSNNIAFAIQNLLYEEDFDSLKIEWIKKMIVQKDFVFENFSVVIERCFWYIKDIKLFKDVVLSFSEIHPFKPVATIFRSYLLKEKRRDLIDEFLITLLIDSKGNRRFTGYDLFSVISNNRGSYKFTYDILSLSPIDQYKLWVSLCRTQKEPKYYIPALLPLLNSQSPLVKETFISKLEELSEDYGGSVTSLLEDHIDMVSMMPILERVKSYLTAFHEKNVAVKFSVKELNPIYTHHNSITKFNSLYYKKMSKSIGENVEKNSLFGVLGASKIQLAKGGGWKSDAKSNISKLSSFESGFSLPRTYFVNPDEVDLLEMYESREDWNDEDFFTINEFLKNE